MVYSFHRYQAKWALGVDNQFVSCLLSLLGCGLASRNDFPGVQSEQIISINHNILVGKTA